MQFLVLYKLVSSVIRLVATRALACVASISSVSSLVVVSIANSAELFGTAWKCAIIWFLSSVGSEVNQQVSSVLEGLAAYSTC